MNGRVSFEVFDTEKPFQHECGICTKKKDYVGDDNIYLNKVQKTLPIFRRSEHFSKILQ